MTRSLRIEQRRDHAQPGQKRVQRRDRGTLRPTYTTRHGAIIVDGVGAVAGVHEYRYRNADGQVVTVRELLDDETLKEDAGQIGRLPQTNNHPDGDVTPENAGDLVVGDVGERVRYEEDAQGGYVTLSVCLRRKDAIEDFKNGKTGLSFGYAAVIDSTPGEHPRYGRYDQRQVKRFYNHLALVETPRHGPDAHLRADAADVLEEDVPEGVGVQSLFRRLDQLGRDTHPTSTEPSMDPTLLALATLLGIQRADGQSDKDYTTAVVQAVANLKNKADAAERARADAQSRADMSEDVLHVMDMMKSRIKDADGYKEDMGLKAMADMMGKAYDGMRGQLDAAKKKADDLEALETKRKEDTARKALIDWATKTRRIDVSDEDKKAALPALRRKIAGNLIEVQDSDSDDYIAAYLGMAMREKSSTRRNLDEESEDDRDQRYDRFRKTSHDEDVVDRYDENDDFYDPNLDAYEEDSAA